MLPSRDGAALTDDEIERRLRWTAVDCVEPDAVDQADLLAFSEGPIAADLATNLKDHLSRCEYCSALSIEYRRIAVERRKKRTFLQLIVAASSAAAAALLALVLTLPTHQQSRAVRDYELALVTGQIARTMALPKLPDMPGNDPPHFAPTSPIEIVLRPSSEQGTGEIPTAVVYVAPRGAALSRVHGIDVRRKGEADYPLLLISGTGEGVFGKSTGEHDLVVLLTADKDALDAIEGKTRGEAKNADLQGSKLIDFDVVYEAQP